MMEKKNIFLSIAAAIFFLGAVAGIGWIAKNEIEKGRVERAHATEQRQGVMKTDASAVNGENTTGAPLMQNETTDPVPAVIENSDQADQSLDALDKEMNDLEQEDIE